MKQLNRTSFYYFIFFNFLLLAITPFVGSHALNFSALLDGHSLDAEIFFNIRLPRVLFAFLIGATLALVGTVFQALLRNDLATPYTLGVSSGGAFGAVLAIKLNLAFSFYIFSSVSLFSIAGSLLSIAVIYFIARNRSALSMYTLILAGVAISFFFSAFNLFIHYWSDFTETFMMIRWLMGSLDVYGWNHTIMIALVLVITALYFIRNSSALNIILAGDEVALSKGVEVLRLQKISFFLGSVAVGVVVAMAGPIGFVGLVVPHTVRLLFGADHKTLLPGTMITGGVFLALCDMVARTIFAPAELPVGVITALFGGPFFLYLLIRKKG